MAKLPSFTTYGEYSKGNYGAHALVFTDSNGLNFWFSYKTLVAFERPQGGRVVIRNYWGVTTGKHLNWIDGGAKATRVDQDTFARLYQEAFGRTLAA